VFERQLKHFEGSTRFRAIVYDPRGQDLSSKTLRGHTYAQHGRDLAAFIQKLGLKNVALAGWSYYGQYLPGTFPDKDSGGDGFMGISPVCSRPLGGHCEQDRT
jgi:pimeloyl-ACP methyl ester carboxylesterase